MLKNAPCVEMKMMGCIKEVNESDVSECNTPTLSPSISNASKQRQKEKR